MAAPDSIGQSLGFLNPMERASNDYNRILETLKLGQQQQATNANVAELGFNMPVYMGLQAASGFPGQGKPMLPDLNQAATPDSDLPQILGLQNGGMAGPDGPASSTPGKASDTYRAAMQYFQSKGDLARAFEAKQQLDKALIAEDKQRRQDEEQANKTKKEGLEADKLKMELSQADNPKPGDFREERQMDGTVKYFQRMRKDGIDIGEKEIGRGIYKSFTDNNNRNMDMTTAQRGDEAIKFRDTLKQTSMVNEMVDRLQGQLKDPNTKTGGAGTLVKTLDNALGSISQVLGISGNASLDDSGKAWVAKELPSAWRSIVTKTGINQADYTNLVMTYATVKAFGGSGGNLSEKDIKRAAEEVGAGITNKETASSILDEVRQKNHLMTDIAYRNILDPTAKGLVTGIYNDYKTRYSSKPSPAAATEKPSTLTDEEWAELQDLRKRYNK